MSSHLRTAFVLLLAMTVITGLLYPLVVTVAAQLLFPWRANGSIIFDARGTRIGSELIGQPFSDPRYFWSRPSATSPVPYNAASSLGSNLGPTNQALLDSVRIRVQRLRDLDSLNADPIPADLVTASGSGLDPHISVAAALYQAGRVAKYRNMDADRIRTLIAEYTEGRQFGLLGEPRVNVLRLNLALDGIQKSSEVQ